MSAICSMITRTQRHQLCTKIVCLQAGAAKVYAVEASDMAVYAQQLADQNPGEGLKTGSVPATQITECFRCVLAKQVVTRNVKQDQAMLSSLCCALCRAGVQGGGGARPPGRAGSGRHCGRADQVPTESTFNNRLHIAFNSIAMIGRGSESATQHMG